MNIWCLAYVWQIGSAQYNGAMALLDHLILSKGGRHCPHLADEKAEAQRNENNSFKFLQPVSSEARFKP